MGYRAYSEDKMYRSCSRVEIIDLEFTDYTMELCQYDDVYAKDSETWYVKLLNGEEIVLFKEIGKENKNRNFDKIKIKAAEYCREYFVDEIKRCTDAYLLLEDEMFALLKEDNGDKDGVV